MKKETLDRAKALEEQIGKYEVIAYITSFPYQKFRLFKKKTYIGNGGYNSTDALITDPELATLIENYCRDKIKLLRAEIEAL